MGEHGTFAAVVTRREPANFELVGASGWTKSVRRTRQNYSNLALRRQWNRPASAPRRVVVVAGCAEAPRCGSCNLHVMHTIATWASNDGLESMITPSDFSFDDNS